MTLLTYNLQLMPLPSFNILHFMASEVLPRKDFKGQGHYSKVKGQNEATA